MKSLEDPFQWNQDQKIQFMAQIEAIRNQKRDPVDDPKYLFRAHQHIGTAD